MISSRRTVKKLLLGHNDLGDDGCAVLFTFLGSQIGQRYPIAEISLNSNGIGNQGLLAISHYLVGNAHLKELFIQANAFKGDAHVTDSFVKAVNSSRLQALSVTINGELGDTFAEYFFPALNCRSLKELHVSSIGMTPRSVPHISAYLRSPERCYLQTFKCNGNQLGIKGVTSLVRVIGRSNYSLTTMEFYANELPESASDMVEYVSDNGSEESTEPTIIPNSNLWTECRSKQNRISIRNATFKREVEHQALQLLRYARTSLLHVPLAAGRIMEGESLPTRNLEVPRRTFPFRYLPTELQLSILSLLAPLLSSAQRLRIFQYASSPETLPPLIPRLGSAGTSHKCLPDPGKMNFATSPKLGQLWKVEGGNSQCGTGQCLGVSNSMSCTREQARSEWLDKMGCTVYDPR
ncbi:RNI-like protein [Coprinopsis marcescibilis]|uniref:RNI-like protein n=1 Tax=Coprinopsis marcescibilis TaxID=230819 RepID=A0A5C3LDV6_COPMA|nr:RNI-like protein [Coprinopsis marcescibilis]